MGKEISPQIRLDGIRALKNKNIPIVLVSRCFNGIAEDVYAYIGGGKQLKSLGIIFSNGLNGPKARIKLLIALASAKDKEKLVEMLIKKIKKAHNSSGFFIYYLIYINDSDLTLFIAKAIFSP